MAHQGIVLQLIEVHWRPPWTAWLLCSGGNS